MGDLAALVGDRLLGPGKRGQRGFMDRSDDGSLLLKLVGAGAFLEGDLSPSQHESII